MDDKDDGEKIDVFGNETHTTEGVQDHNTGEDIELGICGECQGERPIYKRGVCRPCHALIRLHYQGMGS